MHRLILAASISVSALSLAAHASTITGSGGGFSGSGTLTTSANGDGSYTITAISGASSGVGGLFAPGTFHNNDNQLFPSAAGIVDTQGFSFADTQGNTSFTVDIFADSTSSTGYTAAYIDSDNETGSVNVSLALTGSPTGNLATFSPSAVSTNYTFSFAPAVATTPEPSTFLLLETGLGMGLFGTLAEIRRRRSL